MEYHIFTAFTDDLSVFHKHMQTEIDLLKINEIDDFLFVYCGVPFLVLRGFGNAGLPFSELHITHFTDDITDIDTILNTINMPKFGIFTEQPPYSYFHKIDSEEKLFERCDLLIIEDTYRK